MCILKGWQLHYVDRLHVDRLRYIHTMIVEVAPSGKKLKGFNVRTGGVVFYDQIRVTGYRRDTEEFFTLDAFDMFYYLDDWFYPLMKEFLVLGCREVDYALLEEHVAAALYQAGLLVSEHVANYCRVAYY